MADIFFTGFPGFLGVELLPRILLRQPQDRAICLVQSKFASLAMRRVDEIVKDFGILGERIKLVEGDICQPGLGLGDLGAAYRDVAEVWHLAAVYDLEVSRELGMRINVDGTRNVLEFEAKNFPGAHLHYVSTCYVSGRHAGPFRETDLDRGQRFNNYYEETKFLAEVDVQYRMTEGLPTTIYRPSIVVGDSATGKTQKFDGPYFVLQWLLRQPHLAVMPVIGDPMSFRLNMVPRDFVIDAITFLSSHPNAAGRVYQLADPNPLTVSDLLSEMATATDRRVIRVPVPRRLAKWAIREVPGVFKVMRIPAATVDYMNHPTHYLTDNVDEDLAGSGISCPPVPSYLPRLVEFMRGHGEISDSAMI